MDLVGNFAKVHLVFSHPDKEQDQVTTILQVGETENMASDFITSGRVGYLFQNHEGDDWEQLARPEKNHISSTSLFSFLGRISVSVSSRYLRRNILGVQGDMRAGYLSCLEGNYSPLGKVVQRCPIPFPIRTYDMCTQF